MKKIAVLAKQVPDTANVTGDAMKEDGTVNRAALPTIFNPEDLNALELALEIKDKMDWEVHVISMGPPKAVEILKHALYMGADKVFLVSDRMFAGSDTLATSYVLSEAIKKIDNYNLVVAGRQAIDGDTAQVGPQVADKLGFNLVSYVNNLTDVDDQHITVQRDGEVQVETIKTTCPVVLTVTQSANTPRYPNAINMLKYFRAELGTQTPEQADSEKPTIPVITLEDLEIDAKKCGLNGSPTKVHRIKSITLAGGDLKLFENNSGGVMGLVKEIIKDYAEVSE
jgi:electron transfer flavoprotein beta subunit